VLTGAAATVGLMALPAVAQKSLDSPILDDASRLNAIPVARHWRPAWTGEAPLIDALRRELKAAAEEGRPVCVGAARHSMGGQALARGGVAVTLDVGPAAARRAIEPNRAAGTYRTAPGVRWGQVIAALDGLGLSPAVMQSNNDFGVAATLSVNAHGWPAPFGPFGSTVSSFRLMLASGELVSCSRSENSELFALVMGGYGLFGIVTSIDAAMVENALLRPSFELLSAAELGPRMASSVVGDRSVRMAYGRLAVDARRFLREALLVTLRQVPGTPPPASSGGVMNALSREIFRAQIGSDAAKRARWYAETSIGPKTAGDMSRNTLLNEPVANLAGRDRTRVDILHEYFLPPDGLEPFLATCRRVIPSSRQDLLNVTLRYVEEDRTSVLAYARGQRIAAVMLFSQRMMAADEVDMTGVTRHLIDAALEAGGSYYLPYRLHARTDQLVRAYPRIDEFAAAKRRYDPGLLFRNLMWEQYLAK
jgi:FAD/FMN-containing dehydrogenase